MEGQLPVHRTHAIHGRLAPALALERLLRGTGLAAVPAGGSLWRLAVLAPRPDGGTAAAPEDIVVVGTKRDELLALVPNSVSLLRLGVADRLLAPRGVHDLVEDSEGAISTNLGPGRDRIFLRGIADSAFNGPTQSTVTLFLDEARISYATPDPDLRLVDIDHVEMLRGPQGALYGTGALGGIIRVIPNRPVFDRWSAAAALEAGITEHGGPGGAAEFTLNAPLVEQRLALRAVAYADHSAGWIEDSFRQKQHVNRVDRSGGRLALRWRIADQWTADAAIALQWINAADGQYATSGYAKAAAIAEPHDNDFLAATFTIRGVIGPLDAVWSTAHVTHEVSSTYDAGAVAGTLGLPTPLGFNDRRSLKLTAQEWRLSDPSAARPWVAGVALLSAQNGYRGTFLPAGLPAVPTLSLHGDALEVALFGEATQSLGPDLKLSVGGRLFFAREDNEQKGQTRRRARDTGVTPSITLSWAPAERSVVWLRYASALRPGGINPDGDPKLDRFQSDDLKSIELGWRVQAGRRVRVNGALFALSWEDIQSDIVGADGFVRTINAGRARNFGLELSSALDFRPLRIDANVTLQHGRLIRPSAAANAIGDDSRLPVLPDYAGRIKLSYEREIGRARAGWFASARYAGRARLSFDPGLARSMGNYWSLDAGITVEKGPWRAAVTIANLLDGHGDSFGFGNPFSLRLGPQRTPLRPRTFAIRMEKSF